MVLSRSPRLKTARVKVALELPGAEGAAKSACLKCAPLFYVCNPNLAVSIEV